MLLLTMTISKGGPDWCHRTAASRSVLLQGVLQQRQSILLERLVIVGGETAECITEETHFDAMGVILRTYTRILSRLTQFTIKV